MNKKELKKLSSKIIKYLKSLEENDSNDKDSILTDLTKIIYSDKGEYTHYHCFHESNEKVGERYALFPSTKKNTEFFEMLQEVIDDLELENYTVHINYVTKQVGDVLNENMDNHFIIKEDQDISLIEDEYKEMKEELSKKEPSEEKLDELYKVIHELFYRREW
jgi:hypothetical protein